MRFTALVFAVALFASAAPGAQNRASRQTTFEVEQELLRLSNYGVFDFLAFGVDRGTVTLEGYSYSGSLKVQAARVVKRVPGVDSVENRIEELPASPNDDRIRWATFSRIYGDGFLSRYAPEGEMGARYELLRSQAVSWHAAVRQLSNPHHRKGWTHDVDGHGRLEDRQVHG